MNDTEYLKKQILAANIAYRDGHPIMGDQAFDDLCDEYQKLIPEDEWNAFRDSLHEAGGKVKHPFIMGSLNKLKAENPDDVKQFIKDYVAGCLNISAKVDGISSRAHYEDGVLMSLTTRGDGSFGMNITDKMTCIKSLPTKIKCKDTLDIRGELVILKDDFEDINAKNINAFANSRNACAGIMNRKDWNADDVSHVSFIAYTVLGQEYGKATQFSFLSTNGFRCAWNKNFTQEEYSDEAFVDRLVEFASQDFDYDTDGLVLSDALYKNEDRYRPVAQVAFKTNQQIGETQLIDIDWSNVSKDGYICPVAILDPVEIGGSIISRCTLHNLDIMEKLNIDFGDIVQICKQGDVIPKITKVIKKCK